MALRCPTCRDEVLPRADNPAFPFCSARCKEIDLGKWLGEEFRFPDASADSDEDGLATTFDDGHRNEDEP